MNRSDQFSLVQSVHVCNHSLLKIRVAICGFMISAAGYMYISVLTARRSASNIGMDYMCLENRFIDI